MKKQKAKTAKPLFTDTPEYAHFEEARHLATCALAYLPKELAVGVVVAAAISGLTAEVSALRNDLRERSGA